MRMGVRKGIRTSIVLVQSHVSEMQIWNVTLSICIPTSAPSKVKVIMVMAYSDVPKSTVPTNGTKSKSTTNGIMK